MSSSLLRQSLEFVEGEGSIKSKRKKNRKSQKSLLSGHLSGPQPKRSKNFDFTIETPEKRLKENLAKLQLLSKAVEGSIDKEAAEKIAERALKNKPLADKILLETGKKEEGTVFTEEDFQKFEREYFCK